MNSILITGSNRGLGLGLIKTLIKSSKSPQNIFATCRNPEKASELNELASKHSNLHVLKLDVTDFGSFDVIAKQVDDVVKDNGLNVLFNNAGIAPKSTRLSLAKPDDLTSTFLTNAVSPVMLTKAFVPLLKKASSANNDKPLGAGRAAIINMSSILASIEANKEGGLYAYRMSKSALNAASKSISIDLKREKILCVALHPGWVKTDLGGANAPLDIETSCNDIISLISNLNETHNGKHIQHDGKFLPW